MRTIRRKGKGRRSRGKGGDTGGRLPTRPARARQPAGQQGAAWALTRPTVQSRMPMHPAPCSFLFQNFRELTTWSIKLTHPFVPSGNDRAIKSTCLSRRRQQVRQWVSGRS